MEIEMQRTVLFFKWHQKEWEETAKKRDDRKQFGAGAYARK